ncbi:MAG: cob(I)yrinic acid a,c-diamide adenosyltransferase [Fidelibacterota bacterium]
MGTDDKKGLVIVFTGDGKGKTTAALGIAFRALGYNWKIAMIQFIKSSWDYGELHSAEKFPQNFKIYRKGLGFYKIMGDSIPDERHKIAAKKALLFADELIKSGKFDMVILDELNVALLWKLLKVEDVIDVIRGKPERIHLIITGRGAPEELIEMADLVTEMEEVKHPLKKGIKAIKGIDF